MDKSTGSACVKVLADV